jgi:hypothetical protein
MSNRAYLILRYFKDTRRLNLGIYSSPFLSYVREHPKEYFIRQTEADTFAEAVYNMKFGLVNLPNFIEIKIPKILP